MPSGVGIVKATEVLVTFVVQEGHAPVGVVGERVPGVVDVTGELVR